ALEGASPELRDHLTVAGSSQVWISMIGMAYESGASDIDSFIDHVADTDPLVLRERIVSALSDKLPASGDLAGAVAGDSEAIDRVIEGSCSGDERGALRHLLEVSPEKTRETLVDILRRFADEVFTDSAEVAEILARDAGMKAALASRIAPEQAIEIATNGIAVDVGTGTTGVVLVPTIASRPWVIITDSGSLKILCYGASAHIEEDPDAPPLWVVKMYKALGDEKRLRILGVLKDEPSSLGDLAQRLELAKSTVHHHVGMLRDAGLVRVTIGRDKEYSLRTDAVPQAGQLLEAFLTPTGGTS
ncbi:MAG: winged helix-turn-helix transcriptional regulator, partial [Acidimicrobiia bacterium]|nr:winged helix-turn-helix transcriptional regulator [Acidimicrobiia bacterium]NNC91233.1 winged helix-turn-helix transcriptional regulator [Acidimicrobiia bacterium]